MCGGHGPDGRYRDNYPNATLRAWARRIQTWQRETRKVYVYFDNDQKSAAPSDARRLVELLELNHGSPSDQVPPASGENVC
jgi:uncharacterized protein YecE (DUF72 family)